MSTQKICMSKCSGHCNGIGIFYNADQGATVDPECCICLDELRGEIASFRNCKHVVCKSCAKDIFSNNVYRCPTCRGVSSEVLYSKIPLVDESIKKIIFPQHRLCYLKDPLLKDLLGSVNTEWSNFIGSLMLAEQWPRETDYLESIKADGGKIVQNNPRYTVYNMFGRPCVSFYGTYSDGTFMTVSILTNISTLHHNRRYADKVIRWLNQQDLIGGSAGHYRSLLNRKHNYFQMMRGFSSVYGYLEVKFLEPHVESHANHDVLYKRQLGLMLEDNFTSRFGKGIDNSFLFGLSNLNLYFGYLCSCFPESCFK